MEKVTFSTEENSVGETVEYAVINRGNGEFTTMPKAIWDELNADSEGNK